MIDFNKFEDGTFYDCGNRTWHNIKIKISLQRDTIEIYVNDGTDTPYQRWIEGWKYIDNYTIEFEKETITMNVSKRRLEKLNEI